MKAPFTAGKREETLQKMKKNNGFVEKCVAIPKTNSFFKSRFKIQNLLLIPQWGNSHCPLQIPCNPTQPYSLYIYISHWIVYTTV